MKKLFLLLIFIVLLVQLAVAQKPQKRCDALVVFRPMIFIDYNLYHWAQELPRSINGKPKNLGQLFNVLPGLGGGFIVGKKTKLLFSIEATVKYLPFSIDLIEYEGMGSLVFPILANFRFPIDGFIFMQLGGGVQFTQINLHQRSLAHQSYPNPFFMTYIGEVGLGIEENTFLMYFLRFGYHPQQSMTFDFGLKFGLNGSLWE